jgi:hypothetical protein
MCVFPASHLKVHAAIEKGLADEQSDFADLFCSWRCLFLQLHGLADENSVA